MSDVSNLAQSALGFDVPDESSKKIPVTFFRRFYGPSGRSEGSFPLVGTPMEKIVDDSDYIPSARAKRDRVATSSMSDRGVYDSSSLRSNERRTRLELALRSGRLDKADVQVLSDIVSSSAEKESASAREKQALDAEAAKSKSRQDVLDKLLGVTDSV